MRLNLDVELQALVLHIKGDVLTCRALAPSTYTFTKQ